MEIRKVKATEVERVGGIFSECASIMNAKGLFNWTQEYPTSREAAADQAKGTLYGIYEEDFLIGVITLDQSPASEYGEISWEVPLEDTMCVHRIAIDPPYHSAGAASQLIRYAEETARQLGLKAMRIDSFSKNQRAVQLYQHLGFEIHGDIFYDKKDERVRGIPFYGMEKILK